MAEKLGAGCCCGRHRSNWYAHTSEMFHIHNSEECLASGSGTIGKWTLKTKRNMGGDTWETARPDARAFCLKLRPRLARRCVCSVNGAALLQPRPHATVARVVHWSSRSFPVGARTQQPASHSRSLARSLDSIVRDCKVALPHPKSAGLLVNKLRYNACDSSLRPSRPVPPFSL